MHHSVATSPWDAQEIIKTAREYALEDFEHRGGIEAWVLDETSYPKKGTHSVGVGRQLWSPREGMKVLDPISAHDAIAEALGPTAV